MTPLRSPDRISEHQGEHLTITDFCWALAVIGVVNVVAMPSTYYWIPTTRRPKSVSPRSKNALADGAVPARANSRWLRLQQSASYHKSPHAGSIFFGDDRIATAPNSESGRRHRIRRAERNTVATTARVEAANWRCPPIRPSAATFAARCGGRNGGPFPRSRPANAACGQHGAYVGLRGTGTTGSAAISPFILDGCSETAAVFAAGDVSEQQQCQRNLGTITYSPTVPSARFITWSDKYMPACRSCSCISGKRA
jgi:hypothetical protein